MTEYKSVRKFLDEWGRHYNKMPSPEAIDKWNREVDENGGIHPIQEAWEKRYKEVESSSVENNVSSITLTYEKYDV